MNKVKVAKFLMNAFPNKPKYQENHFVQEIFRHPKYIALTPAEKEAFSERLVSLNIADAKRKPFDLFFPSFSFSKLLEGKRVLDLGCGVGGDTIFMGESWKVKEFYGIDVSAESVSAARRFVTKNNTGDRFKFIQSYAEKLPFEDGFFDAIVSHDTIEHVRSVKETLSECKRVLKNGGTAFLVFPSFHLPFGGAHIGSVTKTPFLEWFFSPDTINKAYQEIVSEWEEDLNWYKPTEEINGEWAVVKGGIGVNGTTYNNFLAIANEIGFSKITFIKIPLLYVSATAIRFPVLKFFASLLKPILSINFFKDYFTQRFVFVLEK